MWDRLSSLALVVGDRSLWGALGATANATNRPRPLDAHGHRSSGLLVDVDDSEALLRRWPTCKQERHFCALSTNAKRRRTHKILRRFSFCEMGSVEHHQAQAMTQ